MEFVSNFSKNYPILAGSTIVLGLITLIEKSKSLVNRYELIFKFNYSKQKQKNEAKTK